MRDSEEVRRGTDGRREGRHLQVELPSYCTLYMQVRPSLRLLCTLTPTCHALMRKNTQVHVFILQAKAGKNLKGKSYFSYLLLT